jgi:hypothetical protein
MMEFQEEDVLSQLRRLPERYLSVEAAARIHRLARTTFLRHGAAARRDRWLAWLGRGYSRVELLVAAGVTVVYVAWALHLAQALVAGR